MPSKNPMREWLLVAVLVSGGFFLGGRFGDGGSVVRPIDIHADSDGGQTFAAFMNQYARLSVTAASEIAGKVEAGEYETSGEFFRAFNGASTAARESAQAGLNKRVGTIVGKTSGADGEFDAWSDEDQSKLVIFLREWKDAVPNE